MCSSDSGTSSHNTSHIIAPAARPRPIGKNNWNCSTSKKAGMLSNGCGRDDNTLYKVARQTDSPRGTIVRPIACKLTNNNLRYSGNRTQLSAHKPTIPSGILCNPIATAIKRPSRSPVTPENETPIPIPSVRKGLVKYLSELSRDYKPAKECNVITPKTTIARRALAPFKSPIEMLKLSTSLSVRPTRRTPRKHPKRERYTL